MVRAGKVRAIGTSAMPASDIVEAQWAAERRSLLPFRSEQPTYSILNRGIEAGVLPVAQRHGMGVVVRSQAGRAPTSAPSRWPTGPLPCSRRVGRHHKHLKSLVSRPRAASAGADARA